MKLNDLRLKSIVRIIIFVELESARILLDFFGDFVIQWSETVAKCIVLLQIEIS